MTRVVLLALLSQTMWGGIISWNASSNGYAFEISPLLLGELDGIDATIFPGDASVVPICSCSSGQSIHVQQGGTMAWTGTVGGISYIDQYANGTITLQGTLPVIPPTGPLNTPMLVGFSTLWQFSLNLYTGPNYGDAGPLGDTLLTTVTGSGSGWSDGLLEINLDPSCDCPYWSGTNFTYSSDPPIPEPPTLALSLAGLVGIFLLRRRGLL